jgi:dienelactone hydrolase
LLPKKADKKIPLILAVHGHSASGKEIYVGNYTNEKEHRSIVEEERDIAVQAVKHGYAAIAPDMRAFGELTNHHDPKYGWIYCRSLQMHAQLFGRTLIGERVWDVGRLIDFAETIPCIDMSRIAITGNSGGGTVSLFTAATDTRIALAAPSCYFCTFQHSIAADIPHCECNFIPGIATLGEMWDIAGLVVPRPFLAIAGQTDHWFPIEATKEAFEKLKKIYANNGADDKCELYIGDGGHRYYKDGAWKFIRRCFG